MSSEETELLSDRRISSQYGQGTHPARHSTDWMAVHASLYLTGGVLFTLGSVAIYPALYSANLIGWAYTFGSVGFLFADSMEWLHPSKSVGCIPNPTYDESFEKQVSPFFKPKGTALGYLQRAEVGWNLFLNFIGSGIYLLGSIWYIPSMHDTIQGTDAFIVGSLVIAVSQVWKFIRRGCTNINDPADGSFRVDNLFKYHDLEYYGEVTSELSTFIGGLLYLLGSVVFLPRVDVDTTRNSAAVWMYTIGSLFFMLSGCGKAVEYLHKDHSISVSTSYLTA